MNQQLATLVTLVVATVSGVAIWQEDSHAAVTPAPDATVAVSTGAPAAPSGTSWLAAAVRRCLAGGLTIDLRRTDGSLSLEIAWGERARSPAAGPR